MSHWLIGVSCALLAAFCWALATIWYKQLTRVFSSAALNFHKGWITLVGVALIWPFLTSPMANLNLSNASVLLLSGVIGIGIGDTALFAALKRLSEKQTLLIAESVAPVFVIFGGMLFLGEWLSLWQWLAIALIVLSIDWVIGLRGIRNNKEGYLLSGIGLAVLAALCQAAGVLLVRAVFVEDDIHPVLSTALRIVGGVAYLLLSLRFNWRTLKPRGGFSLAIAKPLVMASVIGTLLALILVQTALGHVNAAVVQTLIATSAIFSALLAFFQGEKLSYKVWFGLAIAWIGVCLMIFSG